ncbi:hypothetical protein HPP92_010055 [Vanilla planifolia]|uniref:Uncharacterized protein n=1 Tax=Vanilla planifolia TaxID=51239 RepID=A0A835QY77_VANPL|nr:hypothetical protein HPP92_010055 [Vanilla planifolia]
MPRINKNPVLLLPQCPTNSYALGVMKHPNPIGEGFATQARLEAAGPECIIPGQITPLRILGVKWALGFISWTTVYIFFDTESQSSSRDMRGLNVSFDQSSSFSSNDTDQQFRFVEPAYSFVGMHLCL